MSVLGSIPTSFTQQTSSSKSFFVQKGQTNNYRLRPKIINEHVETARLAQSVVTSSNNVGQIFRASQDNINGIDLTMESAAGVSFDDFESYANDAALQAVWVETDPSDPATIGSEVPTGGGAQSMQLPLDATAGDEWVKTIAPTDYTGQTMSFSFFQDRTYTAVKVKFFVGDGTNTKSRDIVIQSANSWEKFNINIDDMNEDGGTTNAASITKVGFRLDTRRNNSVGYVDNIVLTPAPGQVQLELWDLGETLPVDSVTTLDSGTQYTELGDRGVNSGSVSSSVIVQLKAGKRQYHIDEFSAGTALEIPSNTILNAGNYYAIVIKYVDTDVTVYGANTNFLKKYYDERAGFAFTVPDNSTPISKIGPYNDLQFIVYSTADCYINTLIHFYDETPGSGALEEIYVENKDMQIVSVIDEGSVPQKNTFYEFKDRVFYFPKGGKFEINHGDDITDSTSVTTVKIGYIFKPFKTYGSGELF